MSSDNPLTDRPPSRRGRAAVQPLATRSRLSDALVQIERKYTAALKHAEWAEGALQRLRATLERSKVVATGIAASDKSCALYAWLAEVDEVLAVTKAAVQEVKDGGPR